MKESQETAKGQIVTETWEDIKQIFQETLPPWERDKLDWVKPKVCLSKNRP